MKKRANSENSTSWAIYSHLGYCSLLIVLSRHRHQSWITLIWRVSVFQKDLSLERCRSVARFLARPGVCVCVCVLTGNIYSGSLSWICTIWPNIFYVTAAHFADLVVEFYTYRSFTLSSRSGIKSIDRFGLSHTHYSYIPFLRNLHPFRMGVLPYIRISYTYFKTKASNSGTIVSTFLFFLFILMTFFCCCCHTIPGTPFIRYSQVDPVSLVTLSMINNATGAGVTFLQNPRKYCKMWQNFLLVATPTEIGIFFFFLTLSLDDFFHLLIYQPISRSLPNHIYILYIHPA